MVFPMIASVCNWAATGFLAVALFAFLLGQLMRRAVTTPRLSLLNDCDLLCAICGVLAALAFGFAHRADAVVQRERAAQDVDETYVPRKPLPDAAPHILPAPAVVVVTKKTKRVQFAPIAVTRSETTA